MSRHIRVIQNLSEVYAVDNAMLTLGELSQG